MFLALLPMVAGTDSWAAAWSLADSLAIGGRFEYVTSIDRESASFPWNTTAQSSDDRTRLMLDLFVGSRYGTLYVKGSSEWSATRPSDIRKRFLFDQGDYLWSQEFHTLDYSLRLFANERRFFTHDAIAPLLSDDLAGEGQDNLGARLDAAISDDVGVTVLYSALGEKISESRAITYLRTAYSSRLAIVSASYLLDDLGALTDHSRAVLKAETSASYKKAYVVLSYQQSDVQSDKLFFPGGRFLWEDYKFDDFSKILPAGAAVFAEARLSAMGVKVGHLRAVYRYTVIGRRFFDDLGLRQPAQVSQTVRVYFLGNGVDLNSRLEYSHVARAYFENEDVDRWRGSVWGTFRNGLDFWIRANIIADVDPMFGEVGDFVHVGLRRQIKQIYSGAHIMFKDLDSIFSATRLAWDAKLALSPNWGFYCRFVLSDQFDVGQMLYTRLSYQPSDRIFLALGYGRSAIGDGPYLLEDQDIELSRFGSAIYTISVRGDF